MTPFSFCWIPFSVCLRFGTVCKIPLCYTKCRTCAINTYLLYSNKRCRKRGKLKCCLNETVSHPEDYDTSKHKNFVIPHEAFAWEGDLGEWTRAWEDHYFNPDDDGPLPHSMKGPSDSYIHPVSIDDFLANLSTLEPCEEDFISYGDMFEPLDPEAIQQYQRVAQENKAYAVEHMSHLLSPFRLYKNETSKQQLETVELTTYDKLLDILSHRKFHGWKYIFDSNGTLTSYCSCSFYVQSDDDRNYAFDMCCLSSESEQKSHFQRVPLQSLLISPKLDAFTWIDSNPDGQNSLFFGFLRESLTVVELTYDKYDVLCSIGICYGGNERIESLKYLEMEALLGIWKGKGFAIQSCSLPFCCTVASESEWKWESSNIDQITVRRNLPLKNPLFSDPGTRKHDRLQGMKGVRKAVRKREIQLVSDCNWWKISRIGIHFDSSVGRKWNESNPLENPLMGSSPVYEYPALGKYEKNRYFYLLPCDIFVFVPKSLATGITFEIEVGQFARGKFLYRIVQSYNIERDWMGCAILKEWKQEY